MMYQIVQQQAAAISYLDMFWLFADALVRRHPAGLPHEAIDVRRREPRGPLERRTPGLDTVGDGAPSYNATVGLSLVGAGSVRRSSDNSEKEIHSMHGFRRNEPRLVAGAGPRPDRPIERGRRTSRDAWAIALGTNPQLQASRQTTASAGQELASSRSVRLPQIQTLNVQAFLTNPISVASGSGQPKAAQRRAGAVHDLGRRGDRADLHRRADQEHDRQQRRPAQRVAGRRGRHRPWT